MPVRINTDDRFLAVVVGPLARPDSDIATIERDSLLVRQACHHVLMTPLYSLSQRKMALRRLCELDGDYDALVGELEVLEYQQNSATSYLSED